MRKKASKRSLVENVFDDVEKLREEGYIFEDIVREVISSNELDVNYWTFRYHYYRIKRERTDPKKVETPTDNDIKAVPSPTKVDSVVSHTAESRVRAIFKAKREQ